VVLVLLMQAGCGEVLGLACTVLAAALFMCVFHFVWCAAVVPTEAELAEQTAILSDVVAQHGDGDLAAMYEHCR
jgi:hypothetical protein